MKQMTKQEIKEFVNENFKASENVKETAVDFLQVMLESCTNEDLEEIDADVIMLDSEYSWKINWNEWEIMKEYQNYKNANWNEALNMFEKDILKLFTKMIEEKEN